MTAYYNEIDPYAAAWLRNLIDAGHIAAGDVDERSIEDVRPDDLRGYTQCHFFAGIGVWSYALRCARWSDDRPVWTGSCPCQPFSAAGKGLGFNDERHLWPAWHWLIAECRPSAIFGEQVASKAVEPWIDLVQVDVEALDYAYGCIPFPAASVTAPNLRDRAFWMAYAANQRFDGRRPSRARDGRNASRLESERLRDAGRVAHDHDHGRAAQAVAELHHAKPHAESCGGARGVDDAERQRLDAIGFGHHGGYDGQLVGAASEGSAGVGPTNGFWGDADWLFCRDGKWRPVEPGTFPLAHGAPARVGRLRAYGNAINARAAEVFIRSVMECI